MEELGDRMDIVALTLKGSVNKTAIEKLVSRLTKALKMNKAHEKVVYDYPVGGKGGTGFTHIQPITESFVAIDVWPDLNGAYLVICSCKKIDLFLVNHLAIKLGYRIGDSFQKGLALR